jgi:hypothetical protein
LILQTVDQQLQFEVLDWISTIKFGKHHQDKSKERAADTCNWLLEDEDFLHWLNEPSSNMLWLQGTGKD